MIATAPIPDGHMARGFILVAPGVVVAAVQPIGVFGDSDNIEFPHLHLSLRHKVDNVDPFDLADAASCGNDSDPLWSDDTTDARGGILSAGFADAIAGYDSIQAGTADAAQFQSNDSALVLWGYFHNSREGDQICLTITDPSGAEFHSQDVTLDRS